MRHTTPNRCTKSCRCAAADGTLCLTAHARIDNRAELHDLLDVQSVAGGLRCCHPGQRLHSGCLSPVGRRVRVKLCGDFAFAIWDEAKQHLFCARDHMGVKPFYYYHDAHIFRFRDGNQSASGA
jgi:asparagine synthase (glutamine-hydrolysing)